MPGPRDYLRTTIQQLFSLAHNECSFPTCTQQITREGSSNFKVNICHIEAASPDGERYRADMTDDERRSYGNLILLCPIHHIETNDVSIYTVEILKQMKLTHHVEMEKKYSSGGMLSKRSSSLIEVINQISSSNLFDGSSLTSPKEGFDIENKIAYNSVKRYKPIIEEYRVYEGKLTKIYTEIEIEGSTRKDILLQNIRNLYLKAKGRVLDGDFSIENIQINADNLIEEVEKELWNLIESKNQDLTESVDYETINPSLSAILVDAFMRCKILEEPPKNDN